MDTPKPNLRTRIVVALEVAMLRRFLLPGLARVASAELPDALVLALRRVARTMKGDEVRGLQLMCIHMADLYAMIPVDRRGSSNPHRGDTWH